MNNTFSIQRFGLLLKRQWLEFGKIYLVSLLVALGVFIAFYGVGLWDQLMEGETISASDLHFREPLFMVFGFIFISVIASTYFAHLGQKPRAIIDLLIPASTFEKFIAGVFFTAILAVFSFLLLFYLTDLAFIAKLRAMYPELVKISTNVQETNEGGLSYFFTKNDLNNFIPIYIVPFFITSVFLLGSIYFNKFHYIKTAISVMIFVGVSTYIIVKSGEFLMSGRIPIESEQQFIGQQNLAELWGTILLAVLTLIFWSITYVRLKEKEV